VCIPSEEHKQHVSQHKVPRNIFRPERDKVVNGGYYEKLFNLCCASYTYTGNINEVITGWTCTAEGGTRHTYKILARKS
jgi:hypothetical protein